jgi:hypothetical protein
MTTGFELHHMPRAGVCGTLIIALAALAATTPAMATAPAKSILKVVNNKRVAGVDDGWVVYQSGPLSGAVRRHELNPDGSLTKGASQKLKTAGQGPVNQGAFFDLGGVTFAPCPTAPKPSLCGNVGGATGVGLAFGQLNFGGGGGAIGGWVTDSTVKAQFTNIDGNPGGIGAVAVGPGGAFAVGYDQIPPAFKNHAVVLTLDAAGQTYAVTGKTDLGTLGGDTSKATDISKGALYIVGMADDAAQKSHAVYAPAGGTSWIDITGNFPEEVLASRALVASDDGKIAGSATVKRVVDGKNKSVDIGFVYDIATTNLVFFEAPGRDVIPLKILSDGTVVGNLQVLNSGAPSAYHPFSYDAGGVHDYGTMTLPGSGPAFGCRVNGANTLGEMVGTCIPAGGTYGATGIAFHIDAKASSPVLLDINASLQTNAAATNSFVRQYSFGSAVSIDDRHTIGLNGVKIKGGNLAGFIATKQAYNP